MITKETLNRIYSFRESRDWSKFHTPKDLSVAISIESAELLQYFLWNNKNSDDIKSDSKILEGIHEEIADILIYLIYLVKELDLDMDTILCDKVEKNNVKYPISKCKGSCKKYTEL